MDGIKIVRASAGSGKTYNLAYEYVRNVIVDPERYKHILAVTFTNKATEEMKVRILRQINILADGEEDDYLIRLIADTKLDSEQIKTRASIARNHILHDYSNFYILTIDKFFQRIIRAFIKEIGIDINFNLELQTDSILEKAADNLIDDMSEDKVLREWIMDFIGENISQKGKWNIKDGLVALGGDIFKENGVKSLSADGLKDELKLLVGESRKNYKKQERLLHEKAEEFMRILQDNSLDVSDFKGANSSAAGYVLKIAEGDNPKVGANVLNAVNDGVWYSSKCKKSGIIDSVMPQLNALLSEIVDMQKSLQTSRNNYLLFSDKFRDFALIVDLRNKIESICAQEHILPISDINHMIYDLVSGNDTPFIFEKTGTRFTHYMIDEFQDTSTMQWRNFLPLLHNASSQSQDDAVMLVGDVKQSIYRWRGGDWSLLAEKAEKEFGQPQKIYLKNNFRSSHKVVEFNNALIGAVSERLNDDVNQLVETAVSSGSVSPLVMEKYHDIIKNAYCDYLQNPASKDSGGYISITCYDPAVETKSEDPVIEKVNELLSAGYRPCDIAILVRNNANASKIATMLLDYKNRNRDKITYNIVTQEALTIGRSDICSFAVSCMGLAVMPDDAIHKAVYNHWLEREFDAPLSSQEVAFFSRLSMKSPQEAFEEIAIKFEFDKKTQQIAFVQAMHDKVISFCQNKIADIKLFLEWWEQEGKKSSIEMPKSMNSITIATIHKSKGLEYNAVILPYCDWSLLPIHGYNEKVVWAELDRNVSGKISEFPVIYGKNMADSMFAESYCQETVMSYIDNLNILYVAVTRAVKDLHIIIPKSKSTHARIGETIKNTFNATQTTVSVGDMRGEVESIDNGIRYVFGAREELTVSSQEREGVLKIGFITNPPKERIAVKYSSDRYVADRDDDTLPMRDYGVLMHRVFENSSCKADITSSIAKLQNDGEISEQEACFLAENIDKSFENPLVSLWFSDSWKEVRTEADLILPNGKTYRPDRVMIDDRQVMVVDYKFGQANGPEHVKQVESYVSILGKMGYVSVKGYLWYINKNEIVEVL